MQYSMLVAAAVYCLLLSQAFAQAETPADKLPMKRAPVRGGELEYAIRGSGEPVLLVHGSHIAGAFLPLMDERPLADYRLIRYHRRGFAGSTKHAGDFSIADQAADALALLKHLGIERAHIVGHSYGGAIAIQMALDTPEVVHSLVLLEPAGVGDVISTDEFVKKTIASARERYEAGDPTGAVDAFMRGIVSPNWKAGTSRTVPGGPEQAERDAATFFEVELPALAQWKLDEEKAQKISQPTLNIVGAETLAAARKIHELVRQWIPHSESYTVPGVTHALQMEDPRSVAISIGSFLRRHPLDRPGR